MYQVQKTVLRPGTEIVVVTSQGRRVGSASVQFVQWMHDFAPKGQLRPEQMAMVDWFREQAAQPHRG
jgi:hypothetical protein